MKRYIAFIAVVIVSVPVLLFAQAEDIDPNPNANDCVIIKNNLRYRDRDAVKNSEVSVLQDFLQSKGYLNSEPTGYFGLLTVKAVKSFQGANNLTPSGYVGSATRQIIQNLTCNSIDLLPSPKITVISPNGGEVYTNGQNINIKWSSSGEVGKVNIFRCSPDGNSQACHVLAVQVDNTGSYNWTVSNMSHVEGVPVYLTGNFWISVDNGNKLNHAYDESDNPFKIIPSTVSSNYDTFATCLKDKGVTFYGTFWCPHCKNQKNLFGSSASLLPYVECSTADGLGQTQICKDKNIQGYPTWVFADGTSLSGEQTLATLSSKTSCTLP